jgi:hypothetical protein
MRLLTALFCLLLCAAASDAGQTPFSMERAQRTLRDLSVSIGPRPMGSPAERRALEYARDAFISAGCDTSYILPMATSSRANTSSGIAVGIRRGATNRIIVIGGHIDSAGPEIPGADDDGSGASVVIEAAVVQSQMRHQSTIVYCCFGGEEEGLEGSRYFVEHFPMMDSVALMLQVDMANGLGILDIDPDTHGASAPSWLVRAAVEEFYGLGYRGLRYPTHFFSYNYAFPQGSGSDHESFLAKGIPAVDFSSDVAKPIHTPRDNFDNFDARGLKRSGDLVLRLADRFDAGVPSRTTEQYWLYLVGSVPVFVPFWGLWLFACVAILAGLLVLLRLRAGRLRKQDPGFVGWSSPKIWLGGLAIVTGGWMSSDLIGVVRGIRHPWISQLGLFTLFGLAGALFAAWIVWRFARWRVTQDPYPLFRTAMIVLVPVTLALAAVSPKLAVEPSAAVFLSALAMMVRRRIVRVALLLFSPVWLLHSLLLSEWHGMLLRLAGYGMPPNWWAPAVANALMALYLSLLLLPFFLTAVALYRESEGVRHLADLARSTGAGVAAGAAFLALGAYLMTVPAYDRLWGRDVKVNQRHEIESGISSIEVRSSEYLAGMRVTHNGVDSVIGGRTSRLELTPTQFDTSWVRVERVLDASPEGGVTRYAARITVECACRPYAVSVRYRSGSKEAPAVESPWFGRPVRGEQVFAWYSFPDSTLEIPVRFTAAKGDSVVETIEVTFDRLAEPMDVTLENAYVIPRTTFVSTRVYR